MSAPTAVSWILWVILIIVVIIVIIIVVGWLARTLFIAPIGIQDIAAPVSILKSSIPL